MEAKELKMDLAGREFKITNSPVRSGANGYALVSLGDTVIMGNASMSEKGREGADFFPLVVDYEENFYAAGKIKGSRFIKRSGRPSENAILISRLIDRPIRPLFPKGTTNEVQLICSALSVDLEVDPATTAMNAASIALLVSGAPFEGPIGAVRMGYKDGQLIVNPTYQECEEGLLNLVVAGTMDAITMVEAAAKEVPEDVILKALDMAHQEIKKICEFQLEYAKMCTPEPIEASIVTPSEDALEAVKSFVNEDMLSIKGKTKREVKKKIHALEEQIFEKFAAEIEEEKYSEKDLAEALNKLLEKQMRKNILEKEERLDGRKLEEIREIEVLTDILPRVHGSAIFRRGETMALTITTLGGPGDAQIVDTMESDITKRYFHHYHFPPFSVGDIKPLRGASRREIGHGDLAERALVPVLPEEADFPYTMWVVSEIVKCNGSSSMASVCGSTLSLMAAGVPIKKPVAGIAMGLVMAEDGNYKILSDIQGMEDFAGDMDFKVTGTKDGITALQMDIKVKGVSTELMQTALDRAKQGRLFILDKMTAVIGEPRKELSKYAPLLMSMKIDPDMIGAVIGKGGETIQKISEECNVEININDDGTVTITAPDQTGGQKAKEWIEKITYQPEIGDVFDGKVVSIKDFGAFVEIAPGKDGLVHISELADHRVNHVEDVVKMGDTLKVKLIDIDDKGRYKLSHKATLSGGIGEGQGSAKPHHDAGHGGGHGGGAPHGGGPKSESSFGPAHHESGVPHQTEPHDEQGKGGHGTIVPGTSAVRKID